MSKFKNLSRKAKVGVVATGAAAASILGTAPLAGAALAARPGQAPAGDGFQSTTVDTPVPGHPDVVLGHSRPDSVTTRYVNGHVEHDVEFKWDISPWSTLMFPDWSFADEKATKDTPYVKGDGASTYGDGFVRWAQMKVDKDWYVLYGPSWLAKFKPTDDQHYLMTGWEAGDGLLKNSVRNWSSNWGHFYLTVTTTDSTDVALDKPGPAFHYRTTFLAPDPFPWVGT
jgi:hypothetical protein